MASKTVIVGPWGGTGGTHWEDGTYSGIRQIIIYSGDIIDSISVEYDKNGQPTREGKHGGNGGSHAEINLQYPDEYLVSVRGYFGPVTSAPLPVVRSLTFVTNKGKTFGPFGEQQGTSFTLPVEGGRIIGFTGRSGQFLDAIAFRLSPN